MSCQPDSGRGSQSPRPTPASPSGPGGFTIVELIIVLVVLGVLTSLSWPGLRRWQASWELQNARATVVSRFAQARATAIRVSRPAAVHIDDSDSRIWIEVDGSGLPGGQQTVRTGEVDLRTEHGVSLSGNRSAFCFDSRGLGVSRIGCPRTGGTLVLRRSGRADTVRISAIGRIRP